MLILHGSRPTGVIDSCEGVSARTAGRAAQEDPASVRGEVANRFLPGDPLRGWHHGRVSIHRHRLNFDPCTAVMLAAKMATIPILVVFLFFQRQFIEGISLGGLK